MKKVILLVLLGSVAQDCFPRRKKDARPSQGIFEHEVQGFLEEFGRERIRILQEQRRQQQLNTQITNFLLRGTQLLNANNDLINRLNMYLPEMDVTIFITLQTDFNNHLPLLINFISELNRFTSLNNDVENILFVNNTNGQSITLNQLKNQLIEATQNIGNSMENVNRRRHNNRCAIL